MSVLQASRIHEGAEGGDIGQAQRGGFLPLDKQMKAGYLLVSGIQHDVIVNVTADA